MKLIESIESDIIKTLSAIYEATGVDPVRIEKTILRDYIKLYKITIEKNKQDKKGK